MTGGVYTPDYREKAVIGKTSVSMFGVLQDVKLAHQNSLIKQPELKQVLITVWAKSGRRNGPNQLPKSIGSENLGLQKGDGWRSVA